MRKIDKSFWGTVVLFLLLAASIMGNMIQELEYAKSIRELENECRSSKTTLELQAIRRYYKAISVLEYTYEYAKIDTTDAFDRSLKKMMKAKILDREFDVEYYKKQVTDVLTEQYKKNGNKNLRRDQWKKQ